MKNKVLIAGTLAVLMMTSCSKSLILSDGTVSKKIKVASKIEKTVDESNNTILSFQSVQGTKYSINTSQYTYIIK